MKTLKQMKKDPQSKKLSFYIKRSFLYVILNKLLLSLVVGSWFMVQTDYALAQRVQDNKFVENGLGTGF